MARIAVRVDFEIEGPDEDSAEYFALSWDWLAENVTHDPMFPDSGQLTPVSIDVTTISVTVIETLVGDDE